MAFAKFVLFSWPLITFLIFRRVDLVRAVLISLIAGYLLLPTLVVALDLPLLPALNKNTIPALSTLFCALYFSAQQPTYASTTSFIPRSIFANLMILGLFVGTFLTVLTNGDTLVFGDRVLPGQRPYDGFSVALLTLMLTLPFFLGHKYLAHPDSHRVFLKILVVAGLLYSLLALYEIRFSPQLNNNIYGFHALNFAQQVRFGGFRPIVFLGHGLQLAIFFGMVLLAAVGMLWLKGEKSRGKYLFAVAWMLMVLILSKSLGAISIAAVLIPLTFLATTRMRLIAISVISVTIMVYPILRGGNYIPTDRILAVAESISPDRAASLSVRLRNEDLLLEKANQRPAFGWGAWGRSRVYDTETGRDRSTTDGGWIIQIGTGGWTRYLSIFGLLCFPTLLLLLKFRRLKIGPETSFLALVLTANVIDLIPNAGQTPITWMLAGALWGRLSLGPLEDAVQQDDHPPPEQEKRLYARPRPDAPPGRPRPAANGPLQSPEAPLYSRQTVLKDRKG